MSVADKQRLKCACAQFTPYLHAPTMNSMQTGSGGDVKLMQQAASSICQSQKGLMSGQQTAALFLQGQCHLLGHVNTGKLCQSSAAAMQTSCLHDADGQGSMCLPFSQAASLSIKLYMSLVGPCKVMPLPFSTGQFLCP